MGLTEQLQRTLGAAHTIERELGDGSMSREIKLAAAPQEPRILGRERFAYAALGRWADADRLRTRIAHRSDSLVSGLDAIFGAMAYGDHVTAVDLLATSRS